MRRALSIGSGPRWHTSTRGRCPGESSGPAEAAAQANGEVQGAGGDFLVALATWMGSKRGPTPMGRPRWKGERHTASVFGHFFVAALQLEDGTFREGSGCTGQPRRRLEAAVRWRAKQRRGAHGRDADGNGEGGEDIFFCAGLQGETTMSTCCSPSRRTGLGWLPLHASGPMGHSPGGGCDGFGDKGVVGSLVSRVGTLAHARSASGESALARGKLRRDSAASRMAWEDLGAIRTACRHAGQNKIGGLRRERLGVRAAARGRDASAALGRSKLVDMGAVTPCRRALGKMSGVDWADLVPGHTVQLGRAVQRFSFIHLFPNTFQQLQTGKHKPRSSFCSIFSKPGMLIDKFK
jgi:hypothetical protein